MKQDRKPVSRPTAGEIRRYQATPFRIDAQTGSLHRPMIGLTDDEMLKQKYFQSSTASRVVGDCVVVLWRKNHDDGVPRGASKGGSDQEGVAEQLKRDTLKWLYT